MTIGTKSVLFGAHQFLVHPWFVAWGWWRLFGFPWDPRLWVAFFVHDLGYIGKPNMDGDEGEQHPALGAGIMAALFGQEWGDWTACHSRYYARRMGMETSMLCLADKLAVVLTPAWLYLPMVTATGELPEYMAHAIRGAEGKYAVERLTAEDPHRWLASVKTYLAGWVAEEHAKWRKQQFPRSTPSRRYESTVTR